MDKKPKKPRLRAPNFTSSDNLLLCDIIENHKNIIENKKTDGANLLQKQQAWAELVLEFNSCTTGHHRTVESLQQNYKNLKKKAKKNSSNAKMTVPVDKSTLIFNVEAHGTSPRGWEKIAEATGAPEENCQEVFLELTKEVKREEAKLKKNIMGTGGGPPPTTTSNELLDKVKLLVGPAMDGMYTIYDGDSALMATQDVIPIEMKNNMKIEKPSPGPSLEESNQTNLKRKYESFPGPSLEDDDVYLFTNDRANLKKKPNPLLTRKQKLMLEMPVKPTVADKFKTLAAEKLELVQLQQELVRVQLEEEKEKTKHNRQIRAMQLLEINRVHEHNLILRQMELRTFNP